MTSIHATTLIRAPIDVCFRLSLSIDAEAHAVQAYRLRAVGGVTHGIIGAGETVTWRTRQFGLWVTHTTLISAHQPPTYFQDRMLHGIFRSFVHDHFFRAVSVAETEMRDELRFSMPVVLGAVVAERIFIRGRMATMLAKRNATIKRLAEG